MGNEIQTRILVTEVLPSSLRSMARDHWATGRFIDLIADIIYM